MAVPGNEIFRSVGPEKPPTRPRRRLLGERNFYLSAFCGAMLLLIGVLGGSQNRRHTGALKPVEKPDSFGIAVKAVAKSRVRTRDYPDQKID